MIVSVFLLGMICGAALLVVGHHYVMGRVIDGDRPPMHRPPMRWLEKELDLDQEQMSRINTILEKHRDEMIGSFEEIRKQIRGVLREDQQERFDEMRPHFMKPCRRPRDHHSSPHSDIEDRH